MFRFHLSYLWLAADGISSFFSLAIPFERDWKRKQELISLSPTLISLFVAQHCRTSVARRWKVLAAKCLKKKKKGKEKKQKKIGNALHVRCDESEATQQPMLSLECVREQWPSYCDCIDVREFLEVAYATGCGRPEKRGEFSKPSYAPVLSVCSINRLH